MRRTGHDVIYLDVESGHDTSVWMLLRPSNPNKAHAGRRQLSCQGSGARDVPVHSPSSDKVSPFSSVDSPVRHPRGSSTRRGTRSCCS